MRKLAMLVGVVVLMTALFASLALAVDKRCTHHLCKGTADNDKLFERNGNGVGDSIYGRAGRDVIRADAFTQDKDILHGNRGADRLNANDGISAMDDTLDTVYGGRGFDTCIVDSTEEVGGGCEDVLVDPGEA